MADWYDAGVGGHAFSDQTTGRIYRVAPVGNKSQKIKVEMGTEDGLITALKSPNIATQDAARRSLIERVKLEPGRLPGSPQVTDGHLVLERLMKLAEPGNKDIDRARAAWTLDGIARGAGATQHSAIKLLKDEDPRVREMAVRMLGRDCRENGKVEYTKPEARGGPAALAQHRGTATAGRGS